MAKIKTYKVVTLNVDGQVEERVINARSLLTEAELKKRIKRDRRVETVNAPKQPVQKRPTIFAHTPAFT